MAEIYIQFHVRDCAAKGNYTLVLSFQMPNGGGGGGEEIIGSSFNVPSRFIFHSLEFGRCKMAE